MRLKIAILVVIFSISLTLIFGIDKSTAENPSDAALLRIGLSNHDSSSCQVCSEGGLFYNSGCKRCIQDGIVITTHTANDRPYRISWSNNNGIYYGDENCNGVNNFPKAKAFSGDTYWIEIIKDELNLKSTLFHDSKFLDEYDSVLTVMCSNPTDLKYLRVSTEDGKPAGNGGRLVGNIDDIQIWDGVTKIKSQLNPTHTENFQTCTTYTCNEKWVLQDPSMLYVDISKKNFYFDSQVTGSNDYAHYDLGSPLSDKWVLRFKFYIDSLEAHPAGKGILQIEPTIRLIVLGIPAIIFPIFSYFISKNSTSKLLGLLITVNGIILFAGVMVSLQINNFTIDSFAISRIVQLGIVTAISVFIIILGIRKFQKKNKLMPS